MNKYLITKDKAHELGDELNRDMQNFTKIQTNEKYEMIFLIDDFSASGTSYIREEDGRFAGKITKFLKQVITDDEYDFIKSVIDTKNLRICVVLYVATTGAIQRIKDRISKYVKHTSIKVEVYAVQELDDSVRLNSEFLEKLESVLENNFQYDDIVTPAYKKGQYDKPHHGFDNGCLALVLNHNCPNNSLPVLWHGVEKEGISALFPRVQRYTGDLI